ncbi:MAG: CDP-alcohol phosphatidyltransferase family protein [Elusimicrobia bacterium]|nr:CDP-alcohol phosphatidyltransferase family protein [Elusimicrobiota bacterium]
MPEQRLLERLHLKPECPASARRTVLRNWIPNILTLGNLAFGFIVIWLALTKRDWFQENSASFFTLLGALLMVACLCDFFDGFVARKMKITSSVGLELDSLADLVSFGVAPVIVFYVSLFDEKPTVFSFAACLAYVLAGAFRLARFNRGALQAAKLSSHFEGLPITGASLLWALLLLFLGQRFGNNLFEDHEAFLRRLIIFMFAAMGYLMISHLPYRSLKTPVQKSDHLRRDIAFLVVLGCLVAVHFGFTVALVLVPILYIFGTPVAAFWKKVKPPK